MSGRKVSSLFVEMKLFFGLQPKKCMDWIGQNVLEKFRISNYFSKIVRSALDEFLMFPSGKASLADI